MIFFSTVMQIVTMRFADISPLGPMHRSRVALFVAILQLNPAFESSVRRGMNAEFDVLGMQSSKKLVSTRGQEGFAMLTSEQSVIVLSRPQLSQIARSM